MKNIKKTLLILLTLPLIFSSCEKEEEETIADNIVGVWSVFARDSYDAGLQIYESNHSLSFGSDNTFEDLYIEDGVVYLMSGTWQYIGGGQYILSATDYVHDSILVTETVSVIFYCEANILKTDWDNDPDTYDLFQKNGYNYQSCSEINL